jgi:hypothetical protein
MASDILYLTYISMKTLLYHGKERRRKKENTNKERHQSNEDRSKENKYVY